MARMAKASGTRLLLTFMVTMVLLVLAAYALQRGDYEAFAGALCGYCAGYWLPGRSAESTTGDK